MSPLATLSVPELMQTDAFQVMVKDPNFRALAGDRGLPLLRQILRRWRPLRPIRAPLRRWRETPSAFRDMLQQASALSAASLGGAAQASALSAMALNPPALRSWRRSESLSSRSPTTRGFAALAKYPWRLAAMSANAVSPRNIEQSGGIQGRRAEGQRTRPWRRIRPPSQRSPATPRLCSNSAPIRRIRGARRTMPRAFRGSAQAVRKRQPLRVRSMRWPRIRAFACTVAGNDAALSRRDVRRSFALGTDERGRAAYPAEFQRVALNAQMLASLSSQPSALAAMAGNPARVRRAVQ